MSLLHPLNADVTSSQSLSCGVESAASMLARIQRRFLPELDVLYQECVWLRAKLGLDSRSIDSLQDSERRLVQFITLTDAVIKQIRGYDISRNGDEAEHLKTLVVLENRVTHAILPVRARLMRKLPPPGGVAGSSSSSSSSVAGCQRVVSDPHLPVDAMMSGIPLVDEQRSAQSPSFLEKMDIGNATVVTVSTSQHSCTPLVVPGRPSALPAEVSDDTTTATSSSSSSSQGGHDSDGTSLDLSHGPSHKVSLSSTTRSSSPTSVRGHARGHTATAAGSTCFFPSMSLGLCSPREKARSNSDLAAMVSDLGDPEAEAEAISSFGDGDCDHSLNFDQVTADFRPSSAASIKSFNDSINFNSNFNNNKRKLDSFQQHAMQMPPMLCQPAMPSYGGVSPDAASYSMPASLATGGAASNSAEDGCGCDSEYMSTRRRRRLNLIVPNPRKPRTADYTCSLCSEDYQVTVGDNPWWAVYSHECPKCLKVQIPRIDISLPSNAIELDPNVIALYGEGVEDSGDDGEDDDSDGENDEAGDGARDDDEAVGGAAGAGEGDVDQDELKRDVHPFDGEGLLKAEEASKLLVLMCHARSCTGAHVSAKHAEICKSTKFLMLHIRDCSGTDVLGRDCQFPWCLPCKRMLRHLTHCYDPTNCVVCNPWTLPESFQQLRSLNKRSMAQMQQQKLEQQNNQTNMNNNNY